LPNDTVAGDKFTAGCTPVPLRLTVCGLDAPLSVIVIDAERALADAGLNVTFTVQEAETARVAGLTGQLLV